MYVTSRIKMDLTQADNFRQVLCVQGDSLTRRVEIELTADGERWEIPSGTVVAISYQKPDGSKYCYDKLPSGEAAWDIEGNVVGVLLDPGMMTVAGVAMVQLKLMLEERTISTFAFQVRVMPGLAPGDDPESCQQWLARYLPQAEGTAVGEYLYVTGVDADGRVTEVTGKVPQIPKELTDRVDALEETAQVTGQLAEQVESLTNFAGQISMLEPRVEALESVANNLPKVNARISRLENQVESLHSLQERVTALETGERPYPECWDEDVAQCIQSILEIQQEGGRNCVSFAFFSNNEGRGGYAGAMIQEIMDACAIPYCFYCGDMVQDKPVNGISDINTQIEDFRQMMAPIPAGQLCYVLGDQDYLRTEMDGRTLAMTQKMTYDRFFRKQLGIQKCNAGGEGLYYFVDDEFHKIRYIVMNSVWMDTTQESDGSVTMPDGYGFGMEQLEWLANEALYFTDGGWGIVLFAHCPPDSSEIRDGDIATGILSAFMCNEAYSGRLTDVTNPEHGVYIDVDYRHSDTADVIGWFCGHDGYDDLTIHDISGDLTLAVAAIAADGTAGDPNNVQGHAIDFVTVNIDDREVFLTRLGAGENRNFSY